MCFVFIWEQTATCATYSINWLVYITEMKSVYCAVRTGSLNKAVCASSVIYFLLLCNSFWHHIRLFDSLPYSLPHPQSICNHQLSLQSSPSATSRPPVAPFRHLTQALLPFPLPFSVSCFSSNIWCILVQYSVHCHHPGLWQNRQVARIEVLWDTQLSQLIISCWRCWESSRLGRP